MRINFDRLSKLAGLPGGRTSGSRMLRESAWEESQMEEQDMDVDMSDMDMSDMDMMFEEEEEKSESKSKKVVKSDDEEVIEVDEVELVQELRRMKNIMNENRRRQALNESAKRNRDKQSLYEAELKRVIDQEVQSVMREMNLTGDWVYGQNKPTRSRNGYSHHGSYLKGIGFR